MDLTGWTPIYASLASRRLLLDWAYTGHRRFTEPFFGDTIDHVLRDPAALLFRLRATLEEAAECSRHTPGLPPAAFVFHMSRCGSTLVAQMLAALPQHRVLSEPTALNALFRAARLDAAIPRATLVHWLRTLLNLLARPLPGETRCFVKFDCWHTLALPLIVEAFPATPWIFLYRDPAQVLVSQARSPGAWSVPSALDPAVFGFPRRQVLAMHRHEYLARALACICDAALQHRHCGRGLFVNYDELPEFVSGPLLHYTGIELSPQDLERLRAASHSDAKNPTLAFSDDRASKRAAVTPALQSLIDCWLSPRFERLNAAR